MLLCAGPGAEKVRNILRCGLKWGWAERKRGWEVERNEKEAPWSILFSCEGARAVLFRILRLNCLILLLPIPAVTPGVWDGSPWGSTAHPLNFILDSSLWSCRQGNQEEVSIFILNYVAFTGGKGLFSVP